MILRNALSILFLVSVTIVYTNCSKKMKEQSAELQSRIPEDPPPPPVEENPVVYYSQFTTVLMINN
jgi:hypothetical protein